MPADPDSVGAWIRAQRQARGWSMALLARHLRTAGCQAGDTGLPGTKGLCANLYRWEAGQGGPSERYRLYLCRALGIPPAGFGHHPLPVSATTTPQESAARLPASQGGAPGATACAPAPGTAQPLIPHSLGQVLEAVAAEFCRQAGLLASLHADCPGYEFWLEPRKGFAPVLVAKRKPGHSGGPHTLVTADPDEILTMLRAPAVSNGFVTPRAPARPSRCYGGRA